MDTELPLHVVVHDRMQDGYTYDRTEPAGKHFDVRFTPGLTPKQMLRLGVFGGVYLRDCRAEFPHDWFAHAKLQREGEYTQDPRLNYFGVRASQPLSVWRAKGWIHHDDPRGWFQWYCRYYLGRRMEDDDRQIRRWRAIKRHVSQLMLHCKPGELSCRPKQRQALLHWAYDSRKY